MMETSGGSWFGSYGASYGADSREGSQAPLENRGGKPTIKRQLSEKNHEMGRQPRAALGDITNARLPEADNKSKGLKPSSKETSSVSNAPRPAASTATTRSLLFLQRQPSDGISTAHDSKRGRHDWIDVDAQNRDDPQAVSEYAQSIFEYLRQAELKRRPDPNYLEMSTQDVNPRMRSILVDWLVEVCEEYGLCADTLYLAVNFIDRFLSLHVVARNQLQLVGVSCMWLAAKYEEIYPPNVTDFCYITDNTYSRDQVIGMEETILKTLKYELTVPTAKTFLRRLLQVCNPDENLHFLSNYLTELALLDADLMLSYLPSEVAAAGIYLSQLLLNRLPWDGTLQHYSMYAPADLVAVTQALAVLHANVHDNPQLQAIREKYGHARYNGISRTAPAQTPIASYHFA